MEALAVALADYKDIVALSAGITTTLQMLSGVFICIDIYKKGNTSKVDVTPFLGGIAIGIIMLQYGLMVNDRTMTVVNIVGITLNIAYFLCYAYYTVDYSDMMKKSSYATAVVAILIGYIKIENQDLIQYRLGIIITVLLLFLIGSPLLEVGEIIRTKNAEKLPFPLIVSGTVVSSQWLLYGIIIRDNFMIIQNVVGFVLSFIQLALCIMYWGNTSQEKSSSKKRKSATEKKNTVESETDDFGERSRPTPKSSKSSNKKSKSKKN